MNTATKRTRHQVRVNGDGEKTFADTTAGETPGPKPEPALTIADLRARADVLSASRKELIDLETQLATKLEETRDRIKSHDGALSVCVEFINRLKGEGAE